MMRTRNSFGETIKNLETLYSNWLLSLTTLSSAKETKSIILKPETFLYNIE